MRKRAIVGMALLVYAVSSIVLYAYYPDTLDPAVKFLQEQGCNISCTDGAPIAGSGIIFGIVAVILLFSALGSWTMKRTAEIYAARHAARAKAAREQGINCASCRDTGRCRFCLGAGGQDRISGGGTATRYDWLLGNVSYPVPPRRERITCTICRGTGACNQCSRGRPFS
jgi:hypothetical protein